LPSSVHFELEPVGEGIWASIARPERGAVGNAAIIDLGAGALVVDTHFSPAAARDLRRAAEELAGPVQSVVNTHWHGDHVNGNASMPKEARIIATARTRELIATLGAKRLQAFKDSVDGERGRVHALRSEGDEEGAESLAQLLAEAPSLEQRLPEETFDERLELGRARILTFGGGHTESDAVVHVADARVVVTADLVVVRTQPVAAWGDPREWVRILGHLEALDAHTIVPGHGPVAGPEAITRMRDYLEALLEAADEAPERFRDWAQPQMWASNVAALRERGLLPS
jgi:cyclase